MGINRHGTGAVWVFVILQRKPIRNRGLFGIRMHAFKADDVGFLVLKIKDEPAIKSSVKPTSNVV